MLSAEVVMKLYLPNSFCHKRLPCAALMFGQKQLPCVVMRLCNLSYSLARRGCPSTALRLGSLCGSVFTLRVCAAIQTVFVKSCCVLIFSIFPIIKRRLSLLTVILWLCYCDHWLSDGACLSQTLDLAFSPGLPLLSPIITEGVRRGRPGDEASWSCGEFKSRTV